ncbi:MAG: hypothetical protein WB810_03660 [Candidatus Cybelea sp.]
MRKTIVAIALASAAALLGGCAGGISGGSMLPATAQTSHRLDVVGGGPPHRLHLLDVKVGAAGKSHRLDIVGGGPPHRFGY